jgi:hypothetical protein
MTDFALFLFSTDVDLIRAAVEGGAAGAVVDWEYIGKAERQAGFDTQINHDTLEDLRRVRACTAARVLCRINAFGPWTQKEIEAAVQAGADEILLPMVRSVEEVERVLEWAKGRCGVGILIETREAVAICERLAQLPLTRAYLGLHDLAIERRTPNPFRAIPDGIVGRVRSAFPIPFGFAGLTLPDRGFPIPCRLLIAEMARLGCSFSFLRRSFCGISWAGIHGWRSHGSWRRCGRLSGNRFRHGRLCIRSFCAPSRKRTLSFRTAIGW